MLDRLLEGIKRLDYVGLLHVYARNLDPTLGQRWYQLHRFFEISLGTIGISGKEPVNKESWYDAETRGGRTDLKVPLRLSASALPTSHDIPCSIASLIRLSEWT